MFQLTVGRVRSNELKFAPDGRMLVVGALPYVSLDTTDGSQQTFWELSLGSWGWALIRGGAAIAHVPSGDLVQVFDLTHRTTRTHPVKNGSARGVAVDPSGGTLYLSVSVPQFRPASEIRVIDTANMELRATHGRVADHLGKLTVSGDSRKLAGAGGDWNALLRGPNLSFRVWDVADGKVPGRARVRIQPPGPAHSFALSHDGNLLAVADGQALTLWSTTSGERVVHSGKHRRSVLAVACHPTRPVLVTGDRSGYVFLWDQSGQILLRYEWGLSAVSGLAFAADGLRCAAVDAAGKVVVWDVDS
jgi:WD40 repeat protein